MIPSGQGIEELLQDSGYPTTKDKPRSCFRRGSAKVYGQSVPLNIYPFKSIDVPNMYQRSLNTEDPFDLVIADEDILDGVQGIREKLQAISVVPQGSKSGKDGVSWRVIVMKDSPIQSFADLDSRQVACKIDKRLQEWFNQNGINATAVPLNGSAEAVLCNNLYDVVVDVVDSGASCTDNELRVVGDPVIESRRILAANPHSYTDVTKRKTVIQIAQAIIANRLKQSCVQIWANVPTSALETIKQDSLLQGMKFPLMIKSDREGWYEFVTSVPLADENDAISRLFDLGADDPESIPLQKKLSRSDFVKYLLDPELKASYSS